MNDLELTPKLKAFIDEQAKAMATLIVQQAMQQASIIIALASRAAVEEVTKPAEPSA